MTRSCRILAIIAILYVALLVGCAPNLNNLKPPQEEYAVVNTKYVAIKFQPSRLSEIKRCLEIKEIEELDVLYEEVFSFLKKRLGDKKTVLSPIRVGVTIYVSPRRLDEVYKSFGGKKPLIVGFYVAGIGEIYSSLWGLNREHINHELAHHIVKKEFRLNLPEEKEEELARCAGEFL